MDSDLNPHLRIIGDVHGYVEKPSPGHPTSNSAGRSYMRLIRHAKYSIQLGDFAFRYDSLNKVDASHHCILAGNHDNYEAMKDYPHFLGNFGLHKIPLPYNDPLEFFFIRGARSIDKKYRILGVSWWPEEELNYVQSANAYSAYVKARPALVITHDCPSEIVQLVAKNRTGHTPSATNKLLQSCYERHKPKFWFFGHHHRDWQQYYDGSGVTLGGRQVHNGLREPTMFICLDELSYLDFNDQGKLITTVPR